jgi:hypothetical protein
MNRTRATLIALLIPLALLAGAPSALAQGELVAVGPYTPYRGLADVGVAIELPFPRVLGGEPPYVYELTAGTLPPPFVTRTVTVGLEVIHEGATFALELGEDGALRGATGFPGRYTGTVTATDANGRTATADFEIVLDLALAYVGDHEVTVPEAPAVVVNGDRVRVAGVPVPALPTSGMDLYFSLTLDPSTRVGAATSPPQEADFDIHRAHGTISKVRATPANGPLRWVYQVVATQATRDGDALTPLEGGAASAPVVLTFLQP